MEFGQLIKNTDIKCDEKTAQIEVGGVSYDSRHTAPGDVFVCVTGFKSDGHEFARAAQDAGASVIVAEHETQNVTIPVAITKDARKALSAVSAGFFGRPSDDMLIFGVTGTNGKTTISYLIKAIVEEWGKECGVIGTIAYVYGGKTFESPNTTPESFELQRMLSQMSGEYATKVCAMEVSSHSLALSRVDDVSFDYSVFTNLTRDHMDFHKDFEDYYQAKKKLFLRTSKANIINIDDEYGKRLYAELEKEKAEKAAGARAELRSASVDDKTAYYSAAVIEKSVSGTRAEISAGGKPLGELRINTPGKFSVENALGAAGVCLEAGIPWESVKAGIEKTKGVAGRFESVENSKGIPVIVDYAHTPDALENVIRTAREFTEKRIIVVFGCGGDRDKAKRPQMGKIAGTLTDYCVITSDNPRTEVPGDIIDDIIAGMEETKCEYVAMEDRRRAIKTAIKKYEPGDVIVIAGKGHEDYQIIGTVKQHFDDRETVLQIIEQEI